MHTECKCDEIFNSCAVGMKTRVKVTAAPLAPRENQNDTWRFADATAREMEKTVGAYGSDLVPSTQCKSVTGVERGEELFSRPELYRPWRTASTQRHAEVLVGKEMEIETLTKRNSDLRTELATLQRELTRTQQRLRSAENHSNEAFESEISSLKSQIAELKGHLETEKVSAEHQLRIVRTEHESELKQLQTKVKLAHDAANDTGGLYSKQLDEVKAASAREVHLVQQLCHARTAELQNELDAAKDANRRLQERTSSLLADAQSETRRTEERCMAQLKEQELRFDAMRSQLQKEVQDLETERDALRTTANDATEQSKTASFDLSETEARFKDWNVRLLSDLDQLYEYYLAVVRDVEGGSEGVAVVRRSADDGSASPNEGTLKGVMERVANRLQQLTVLKQQHAASSAGLMKKIRDLENSQATSHDLFRRNSEEKDMQLTRLYAETSEAKSRQTRLEKAFEELRAELRDADSQLKNAAHRLQFFADDLQASLSHMGPHPSPPQTQCVTFASTFVEGAAILWESAPHVMQASMSIANDILRAKLRQFGGYEFASDSGCLHIAFHDTASAVRFALESQQWLLRARWPPELAEHAATRDEKAGETVVFRGLRVGITVHYGEADFESTNIPIGIGAGRAQYHGRAVHQLLHMSSLCSGGQVVVSEAAWHRVKHESATALNNPVVSEIGQHRISVASRGDRGEQTFSTSEMVTLYQVMPRELAPRGFSRETVVEATGGDNGVTVASYHSQMRRSVVAAEVSTLRGKSATLMRAAETLADETEAVTSMVSSLACKLRDAQVNGRIYGQADIVAHIAAIDRIVARSDVIKRDVERVASAQREQTTAVKTLEEQVTVQTKIAMTEDEFKKKLELANERANEQLFEQRLRADHEVQQLRNALARAESAAADLRRQLVSANNQSTDTTTVPAQQKSTSGRAQSPATTAKKPPQPVTAKSTRLHNAIQDSKKPKPAPKR